MDMNDPFDKTVRREEAAGLRSFSWAGRELRFCGERTTLHVAGVSYDMEPVLDALRHAGVRVRGISPARWISLLRGCPTVLPGCDKMFVMAGTPAGRKGEPHPVTLQPGTRSISLVILKKVKNRIK